MCVCVCVCVCVFVCVCVCLYMLRGITNTLAWKKFTKRFT